MNKNEESSDCISDDSEAYDAIEQNNQIQRACIREKAQEKASNQGK